MVVALVLMVVSEAIEFTGCTLLRILTILGYDFCCCGGVECGWRCDDVCGLARYGDDSDDDVLRGLEGREDGDCDVVALSD